MKQIILSMIIAIFCISCKSYMEYTAGTKELNYSFSKAKAKRYSSLEKALKAPDKVVFLDISLGSNSAAKQLNDNLTKFKNLKKLTINCYGVSNSNFPQNIFKCSNLEFLVIFGFENLDHQNLKELNKLDKLVFLSLTNCNLKFIPKYVYQLNKLEGLDLTLNNISSIPNEIGSLKTLRTIDLTNNCLTRFPMNLSNCSKLEWIDVNNAEGDNKAAMERLGFCINQINKIEDLNSFASLKEVSVFRSVNTYEISRLKKAYPNIKF